MPRDEHAALLARIRDWLRPGGRLLATLASSSHPGYTEDDFFGARMYWSHYDAPWYAERLAELGFEILHLGAVGSGYRAAPGLPPERHPTLLARLGSPPPARGRSLDGPTGRSVKSAPGSTDRSGALEAPGEVT